MTESSGEKKEAANGQAATKAVPNTPGPVSVTPEGLTPAATSTAPSPSRFSLFDFHGIALSVVIATIVLDSQQLHLLHTYCRMHGGFYFLGIYIIFTLLVEFPLLQLLLHISQHTQAGLSKVFGVYGPAFRCIGVAMLATVVLHHSVHVHFAADKISFFSSVVANPAAIVTCNYKEFDCSDMHHNKTTCCTSLFHSVNCSRRNVNISLALGSKCLSRIHENLELVPASRLFIDKYETSSRGNSIDVKHLFAVLGVLGVTSLLAMVGETIFTYIVAGLGVVAMCLFLALQLTLLILGKTGLGFVAMMRLTQPERFMTSESWKPLMHSVISLSVVKFCMISASSYFKPSFNTFRVAYSIQFGQLFFSLLAFLSSMAVAGIFEGAEGQKTSYETSFYDDFYKQVIPEFLVSYGHTGGVFHLYYITDIAMGIGALTGPFYTCFALARDHFPNRSIIAEKISIFALFLLQVPIALYNMSEDDTHLLVEGVVDGNGGMMLAHTITVCVVIYGPLEMLLDRSAHMPHSDSLLSRVGPLSPAYPWILTNILTILLVMMSAARAVFLFTIFQLHKDSTPLYILDRIVLSIPTIAAASCLAFDLFRADRAKRLNWSLFYPTEDHPSYNRIMTKDTNDEGMSRESTWAEALKPIHHGAGSANETKAKGAESANQGTAK